MTTQNEKNDLNLDKYKLVLRELYTEQRHRRDYSLKAVIFFTSFCAIVLGLIMNGSTSFSLLHKLAISLVICSSAIIGYFNLERQAKSYAQTAKVIVKINERLGFFDDILPEEWAKWGSSVRRWPQVILALCCVCTSLFVLFAK